MFDKKKIDMLLLTGSLNCVRPRLMRDPYYAIRFLDGEGFLGKQIPTSELGYISCIPIIGVHDELLGVYVEKTDLDVYPDLDGEEVEEWVTTFLGTYIFAEEERVLFCKECRALF